jgi:hypothetical protein
MEVITFPVRFNPEKELRYPVKRRMGGLDDAISNARIDDTISNARIEPRRPHS